MSADAYAQHNRLGARPYDRAADSHGCADDHDAMSDLAELRAAYLANVKAIVQRLSSDGKAIVAEYLDLEGGAHHDACVQSWAKSCENHIRGNDA